MQSSDPPNTTANVIVTELESAEARLKLEVIQKLIEPCDRAVYGERLRIAAQRLNCSVRTVQPLVRKWEDEGLAALMQEGRRDRGAHRISEDWQTFIVSSYGNGKRTPAQVVVQVE